MTKGKTEKLGRTKKGGAKAKKPSGAIFTALPGWIQGDFLPPTVTTVDVENLVAAGLVTEGSWRLSEGEIEPEPCEGERVLLLTHVERGFSLPPHPFIRGFLNFFGAQLHHFPPNAISYIATFITLCECFLGCPPHWGVFKRIFTVRSQNVKKANRLCGGLGIQKGARSSFPSMTFPQSVRGWQSTWFYCNDVASPNMSTGLPPFTPERPTTPKSVLVLEEEKIQVGILVNAVVHQVCGGVTGMDLLETFLSRWIQPLQARDHTMWHYSGPEDTTRTHPEEVSEETIAQWLRSITGACDNPLGSKRILPFSAANPPPNLEVTNMYSPVPNGNQPDDGEESADGSVDIDYAEDSEGDDEDSEEDEEEDESPPRTENHSKQRQEPVVAPSKTLASSSRNPKRDRASAAESSERATKQPKTIVPKPRKTLPRMKIVVPVASTAAT